MDSSKSQTPILVIHLEMHLGPIQHGWTQDTLGRALPCQIVKYRDGVDEVSVAYSTLGLSNHELVSKEPRIPIRQEFLLITPKTLGDDVGVSRLAQIAEMALNRHEPLLRGQVVGPAGPVVESSQLTAFYVSAPSYLPEAFGVCETPQGRVMIAWLFPISTPEANFISLHGWNSFEDKLVDEDPDLTDYHRASLVP